MFYIDTFFTGVETNNGNFNARSNSKKTLNSTYDTSANESELVLPLSNLIIYPNPTSDNTINVKFQLLSATEMAFKWFDLTGRRLAITNQKLMAGSQHIGLDVSKLPNGVFILQVTGTNINFSKKVIINRKSQPN